MLVQIQIWGQAGFAFTVWFMPCFRLGFWPDVWLTSRSSGHIQIGFTCRFKFGITSSHLEVGLIFNPWRTFDPLIPSQHTSLLVLEVWTLALTAAPVSPQKGPMSLAQLAEHCRVELLWFPWFLVTTIQVTSGALLWLSVRHWLPVT